MKFDKSYAIADLVSKDPTRSIQHLWFDATTERLIATNGWVMAVVPVTKEDDDTSGAITAVAVNAARKVAKKDKKLVAAIKANKTLGLTDGTIFPRPEMNETDYPPYAAVKPSWKRGDPGVLTLGINPRLLLDTALAVGRNGDIEISILVPQDGKTMLEPIIIHGLETAEGLIMPCRVPEDGEYHYT